MVLELPESAAHVATDPKRVYQLGAGFQPLPAPGAPFFLTRPCLRPCPSVGPAHDMLDGLRQGLVRTRERWQDLLNRHIDEGAPAPVSGPWEIETPETYLERVYRESGEPKEFRNELISSTTRAL